MIFELLLVGFCFVLAFIVWRNEQRLRELENRAKEGSGKE